MHLYPKAANAPCPTCGEPYVYNEAGGGKIHALCFELTALRDDLAWLRDAFRKSRIVADECAKIGAQLSAIEKAWPPDSVEAVSEARSRVTALKFAAKQMLGA